MSSRSRSRARRGAYALLSSEDAVDGHERGPSGQGEHSARALPKTQLEDVAQALREVDAHKGVAAVEGAARVYGRRSRWVLFGSLGLASYIYSLDSSTTSAYLAFAASAFGAHALLASVQVAQGVIVAVGKPVIAKVADVTSRATAYLGVLIFYVVGYTMIASAQSVGSLAGGIVVYAVGYTGLQLLTQIIIADLTTLQWRGLVSSLVSMPFVVNGFVGPNIAAAVLESVGWRWGYGMFALFVPLTLLPLIVTLFWAERKAKRLGIVDAAVADMLADADTLAPESNSPTSPTLGRSDERESLRAGAGEGGGGYMGGTEASYAHGVKGKGGEEDATFAHKLKIAAEQLDLVGLVLLGGAVSCILLPLTLAESARGGWRNPSIITMLVTGLVLLVVFAFWDLRYASRPVIAPRFVRNPSVVFASVIGFFDFMSFWLTFTYLYTFVLVVKPWSLLNATYFMQTQTVALTVFGFFGGSLMWYFRRFKPILIGGLCVRLLGVALMIHSRGANASTAELVWTQILQGVGGGFAASASQVGAQASVPHVDVAMVTAAMLLLTEIGGAIGSAMAGAIWSNTMPDNLERHLAGLLSPDEIKRLFGSIDSVLDYPRGDPVREGVIAAYDETMKVMVVAATVLSVVPILASLFMPNWYLGDTQNAVDDAEVPDPGEVRDE